MLQQSWEIRIKLMAEGRKLMAEGSKIWAEANELMAEGNKLIAEGSKLMAEGDIQWFSAIIAEYGNVEVSFDFIGNCTVDNKHVFVV